MKRILLLTVLTVLGLFLVGCSNSTITASSKNGKVFNGKNELDITEYSGVTATQKIDGMYTIDYYLCDTEINCPHNTSGIFYEDFTEYEKGKYYTVFLDSEVYLYYPYKKQFIESHCLISQDPNTNAFMVTAKEAVKIMYEQSKKLALSTDVAQVAFNDKVIVTVTGQEYHVRPTEIVIPGLLRVTSVTDQYTNTVKSDIGGVQVAKMSTDKFDYYIYNDILIQAQLGIDVSTFITLK